MHHSLPKMLRGVVWISIIVGMHFLFSPVSSASSGEQIVGYVEQVKGPPDGYRIERNNQELSVSIFTQIQVGDRIVVDSEEHLVVLRLGHREIILVDKDNSPYAIVRSSKPISVSSNVLSWMKSFISDLKSEEPVETVTATTRSASYRALPPNILLTHLGDVTFIKPGAQSLKFEWVYGIPPFSIQLTSLLSNKTIFAASDIHDSNYIPCNDNLSDPPSSQQHQIFQISIQSITLGAGDYRLSIGDSLGNVGVRTLSVSDKAPLDYRFEARQLIGNLSSNNPDAELLLTSLLCGSIQNP